MIKKIVYGLSILALVASFVVPSQHVDASRTSRCGNINVLNTPGCRGYNANADYYSTTTGVTGQNILYNTSDRSAWAIPSSVNTKTEFKNFIRSALGTTTTYGYNKSGAAFIVNTMLGEYGACNGNFCSTTAAIGYAQAHIADWDAYVDHAGVNWNYVTSLKPGDINSLHACTKGTSSANCSLNNIISGNHDAKDFTFYRMESSDGTEVSNEIRFYDSSGSLVYRLRRQCANLIGDTNGLEAPSNYSLKPTVGATVKDNGTTVPGNIAQVGNTVTFTYAVTNSGDASDPVACTINSSPAAVTPSTGCPRTFPARTTTNLTTETITITNADINKTICRSLTVNPYKTGAGARTSSNVCVMVAAKPYVTVVGGDVSAGNGISNGANATTCTPQANAAITTWNQNSGGFNGAGTQFAAMALDVIDGFATAKNVSGANVPSGLAFSNTVLGGGYGGSMGTLPCVPDYYSQAATTTAIGSAVNVSSLTTGAYNVSGNATLSGNVNPGNRIVLYVDGDAYISGNITYPGSWTYDKIPLFEIIVRGNIYIDKNVTQLDGAYIAQQDAGGANGVIYTCATSTGPYALDGTLYSNCKQKLTVNGLFSAYQVELMRTYGTLSQATSWASSIANAAEVFNYNPTLWIAQPPAGTTTNNSTTGKYDAITSLPPIL